MVESKQNNKKINKVILPDWAATLLIIFFIIIIGFVLYLQIVRYNLVGEAINKGDLASSALLLSPEISASVSKIITVF
jgi:hypothetical protein